MSIWLSGDRITATKLNTDIVEAESASTSTTTSTTFANLASGAFSTTITVPPSGRVKVTIRSTQRNSGALNSITSFDATGSVSGTVHSASSTSAVIVSGTTNISLSLVKLLSDMTAGEILTVTTKHRVNSASTFTADYRTIHLEQTQ